jgi:hypothetical protein
MGINRTPVTLTRKWSLPCCDSPSEADHERRSAGVPAKFRNERYRAQRGKILQYVKLVHFSRSRPSGHARSGDADQRALRRATGRAR